MSKKREQIPFPHDRAYKSAMSNVKVARDFLEHALPVETRALLDLDTLRIQNGSFVDEALKVTTTDILYAVNLRNLDQEGYVYLLCEHQSKPDYWMPFRLLQYCCRILAEYLEQHPKAKVLPVVIPVVLFNGEEAYVYSTRLLDLFGDQQDLMRAVLTEPFALIDLARTPDEALVAHPWSGLMEMVLKHARYQDSLALAEKLAAMVCELMYQDAEKYVLAMLQYALEYTDTEKIERFLKMVTTKLAKPEGEKIMYAAEYLRQEGFKMAQAEFVSAAEHLRQEGRRMAEAEFRGAAEHLRQEGRRMAEAEFKDAAKHLRQEGRQEGALQQKAKDYAKLVKNLGDETKAAEALEISLAELRKILAIRAAIVE